MAAETQTDAPRRTAFVRTPSPRLADAELTFLEPSAIDVERARAQHAVYRELLVRLGLSIVELPPAPEHPDGVFVEDIVVVCDSTAVLTRPGALSRRGEVETAEAAFAGHGLTLHRITEPGTMDGGDVLQVGDTVYVGRTQRTNDAAASQLADLLAPLGRTVVQVGVTGALHLKSAVTALPDGTLIAHPDWFDTSAVRGPILPAVEPSGADVLLVGDTVVISASAPETAELIRRQGFTVEPVDIGEFEKCEAGVTCLSVLSSPPARP
jgi:dimethylargininase